MVVIAMQLACYLVGDLQTLEPLADLVVQSVEDLISHAGEFIWEQEKSNVRK